VIGVYKEKRCVNENIGCGRGFAELSSGIICPALFGFDCSLIRACFHGKYNDKKLRGSLGDEVGRLVLRAIKK